MSLTVHYQRPEDDYTGWNLLLWKYLATGSDIEMKSDVRATWVTTLPGENNRLKYTYQVAVDGGVNEFHVRARRSTHEMVRAKGFEPLTF